MNRAFSSFLKLFLVAIFAASTVAFATEEKHIAKADPAKGEVLYTNGDGARGIPACVSCHGSAKLATPALNPKLAGQHDAYLVKELHNFTETVRNNAIMSTYAKLLTDDEIRNVAAFLGAQASVQGAAKNKDIVEAGKKIYRAGITEKHVPACAGCHSPNGAGIPAQFPRLAGQNQDYTLAQLMNFRTGARKNSIHMTPIAKNMSDEEMQAVADYVAGLR